MRKTLYALLILPFISSICHAQDPAFSQFYNAKTYLNPATVGFEQGLSLASNSRYQWIALDRGFVTHYAAIEKQEPSLIKKGAIGLAASVFQTTEGFSGYSRSGGSLTLNSIFGDEKTTLSGGFNLRWLQERVDPSKFVFSDQLDPIFGDVLSSSFQPDYLIPRSFLDMDVGFLMRRQLKSIQRKGAIYKPMFAIGASMSNLLGFSDAAQNSFLLDNISGIKPRLCIHGGMEIPLKILKGVINEIIILPIAKLVSQGDQPFNLSSSLVQVNWGAYFIYNTLYLGAFLQSRNVVPDQRNTTSFVTAFGIAVPLANLKGSAEVQHKLFIGLSVDVNATALGSSTGNSFELAFRYNFGQVGNWFGRKKNKSTKNRVLNCYHFI